MFGSDRMFGWRSTDKVKSQPEIRRPNAKFDGVKRTD